MSEENEVVRASAPGKVILFGEHAVVYGVTAIAAALSDLRIYVEVTTLNDRRLEIFLHDLGEDQGEPGVSTVVSYESLRLLSGPLFSDGSPLIPRNPTESELQPLRQEFSEISHNASQGIVAICYLISRILPELLLEVPCRTKTGLRIDVKSKGLPIGAGLGSSASFSVALAGALLFLRYRIKLEDSSFFDGISDFDASSYPVSGAPPPISLLPIINGWAYAAEVVTHGAPSGLDNATSCFGGAVRYDKTQNKFDNLPGLPDIQILLTNTKVPRSTKQLVAGVRVLHDALPSVVQPILQAVEGIAQRFLQLIARDDDKCVPTSAQRKMLFEELSRLIRINNDLLNALGVGHPALTAVSSASQRLGLASKLTGAGGGGCAFTLLEPTHSTEAQAEKLGADRTAVEELRSILSDLGFETFQSAIAGDGVRWHAGAGSPQTSS